MNRTGEILRRALGIVFVIVVPSLPIFAAKTQIKAQIADVFAFRSYDGDALSRVTLILCVDPVDEPANGLLRIPRGNK